MYVGDYSHDRNAVRARPPGMTPCWNQPTSAVRRRRWPNRRSVSLNSNELSDPFTKLLEEFPGKYASLANRRLEQIERRAAGEQLRW